MYKDDNVFTQTFTVRKVLLINFFSKQEYMTQLASNLQMRLDELNMPNKAHVSFTNNTLSINGISLTSPYMTLIDYAIDQSILDFLSFNKADIIYTLSTIDQNPKEIYNEIFKNPTKLCNRTYTSVATLVQF